jgi:hypothetical protein
VVREQGREVYAYAGVAGEKDPERDKANISITNDEDFGSYAIRVPSHLWKVLLILDTPGLGVQDITTQNAKAFAVWTENTLPAAGTDTVFARWNENGMQVITVEELERRLNNEDENNVARGIRYNFFSTLPSEVATIIKRTTVSVPRGKRPYTAFLMAQDEAFLKDSVVISTNATIGQNSISENLSFRPEVVIDFGTEQVSTRQVGITHTSGSQASINQDCISEVGISQISELKIGTPQVGSIEVSSSHAGLSKVSSTQVGPTEINSVHKEFIKVGISETNSYQIRTSKNITPTQIDPTEIPLSSSISLQQFLSSHDYSLQNTTLPTWLSFLMGITPFNLNIAVTDLPAG